MVDIIECADIMGQSKRDFLKKGVAVAGSHVPRAMMWIELPDVTALKRVADLLGVKAINKRKNDYVFALAGTIYYAKD
ncbi:hypothetical protein GF325_00970 [Candidatus Bathyarchaeota archaeon]|nr:hypothetical protein [Candidatus Bathyarchaeota archaeon]